MLSFQKAFHTTLRCLLYARRISFWKIDSRPVLRQENAYVVEISLRLGIIHCGDHLATSLLSLRVLFSSTIFYLTTLLKENILIGEIPDRTKYHPSEFVNVTGTPLKGFFVEGTRDK